MGNSVAVAKLNGDKNFCTIDDVELCFKGVQEVYTIDETGLDIDFKESYTDEMYPAYFFCNGCDQDWVINAIQTRDMAFKLVKEHLAERE